MRGHEIELDWSGEYRYTDTKELTVETWTSRPCGHCGLHNTIEGHDGCLKTLPGIFNACCGHGHEDPYLQFLDGSIVSGDAAWAIITKARSEMSKGARHHEAERFGRHGECRAKAILERRGYTVAGHGGTNGFDFLVNKRATLDVKAATIGGPGGRRGYTWQASLARHNTHFAETIVIVLCFDQRDDDEPITVFIIPGELTKHLRKLNITSRNPLDYGGKWACYRDNWTALDEAIASLDVWQEEIIPF